jgi:hypothetical protein
MKQARENRRALRPAATLVRSGAFVPSRGGSWTKVGHLLHCASPCSRPFNLAFFEPVPFLTPFGHEAPIFLASLSSVEHVSPGDSCASHSLHQSKSARSAASSVANVRTFVPCLWSMTRTQTFIPLPPSPKLPPLRRSPGREPLTPPRRTPNWCLRARRLHLAAPSQIVANVAPAPGRRHDPTISPYASCCSPARPFPSG